MLVLCRNAARSSNPMPFLSESTYGVTVRCCRQREESIAVA